MFVGLSAFKLWGHLACPIFVWYFLLHNLSAYPDACLSYPRIVCPFRCLPGCLCCYLTYLHSVCLPSKLFVFHLYSVFCLCMCRVCLPFRPAAFPLVLSAFFLRHPPNLLCLLESTSCLSDRQFVYFSIFLIASSSMFLPSASVLSVHPSKTRQLLKNKTSQFGHSMC